MRTWRNFTITVLAVALSACSKEAKVPEVTTSKSPEELKPSIYVPPPTEHYEGTPHWLVKSQTWPTVIEAAVGPDGEYTHDSLVMRVSGEVMQSFISGPKGKDHPIMCWVDLSVRPVPKHLVGRTFNVDSVIFFDPIKKKRLPALPMLSIERHTEKGVVRTRFSNNMAILHSPDLQENQALEPTVYISSVGNKSFRLTMQPMSISFIREIKPEGIPTDSLKWGPT